MIKLFQTHLPEFDVTAWPGTVFSGVTTDLAPLINRYFRACWLQGRSQIYLLISHMCSRQTNH